MPRPFYQSTEAALAAGAANVVALVTPSPATWGLTAPVVAGYTTLSNNFSSLLAVATAPATRTSVSVEAKNSAKQLLRAASVNLARMATATSTVTNAMLMELGCNERAVRTPRPVPSTPPTVD